MVKATISQEECIGCQACISVCEKYLEYDGEANKVKFKGGKTSMDIPDADKKSIKDAEDICPVDAIKVE